MSRILLSKSEEKLMNFLWKQDQPLTVQEMSVLWTDKTWTDHYIRLLLKGLEKKHAIECCGVEQSGRQYSRKFRCAITKEEYYSQTAIHNGVSFEELIHAEAAALTKAGDKEGMDDLVQKLESIIDEFRTRSDDKG